MKRWSAAKYLLVGHVLFFGLLLLCLAVLHNPQLVVHGISYFGVRGMTILPYLSAFVIAAWCLWQASRVLPVADGLGPLRGALRLMTVLALGISVTPYALGPTVQLVHDSLGGTLFLTELVLAGWLALRVTRLEWHRLLAAAQLVSGIVAGLSLFNVIGVMFYAQLTFQALFAVLIVSSVAILCDGIAAHTHAEGVKS